MCGIAALYSATPIPCEEIKKMTDIIYHRGPDGAGHQGLFEDRLWLGHRRLAIVDLTAAGHQPMSYNDKDLWITYNGEIYNYIELRAELTKLGYKFHSQTDTEVILAAYTEWGEQCLHRFNGMWAFVIVDVSKKKVFAARDRFGVKPLYYSVKENKIGISSEIKQLLVAGFGTGKADREEVSKFLLYGEVNIRKQSLFEGIYQLLPGESLSMQVDSGVSSLHFRKYYHFQYIPSNDSWEQYQHKFNETFMDAVRIRLRSDVSVGSCLSGGLDSSSIVLTLSKLLSDQQSQWEQKTFTSCFDDKRFDEWEYAKVIAEAANAKCYQVYPDMDRLIKELPEITWHQEEPFRSSSIYAQWNVMRKAHESGVTVMLDGQGADEVMAGYHSYLPLYFSNLMRSFQWSELIQAIREFNKTGILGATDSVWDSFLKSGFYLINLKNIRPLPMKRLMKNKYKHVSGQDASTSLHEKLIQDVFGSLQSLLRHEDRNSMAFSIEARTPFLDYRIVELCLNMPNKYKYRNGWTKPLLRGFNQGLMPDKVRLRVDKKGFVTPESVWFQKHYGEIKSELLASDSKIYEWIEKKQLEDYLNGNQVNKALIWRMLSLNIWLKRFNLN